MAPLSVCVDLYPMMGIQEAHRCLLDFYPVPISTADPCQHKNRILSHFTGDLSDSKFNSVTELTPQLLIFQVFQLL